MKKMIQIFAILLVTGSMATADCVYSGQTYPEGAVRGPYICINGDWVRR